MEKFHNKWAVDTEKRAKGDEGYWDIWKKHFAPSYRNQSDRFLILTRVCEEMWDGHNDCKHKDLWDNKYDGRGDEFRTDYRKAVVDSIQDNLDLIKLERLSKGDL